MDNIKVESMVVKRGGFLTPRIEREYFGKILCKYGSADNYQRFSSISGVRVDFDYVFGYVSTNGSGRCNLDSYLDALDWLKTLDIKEQDLLHEIDNIVSEREKRFQNSSESNHAIVLRKWKEVQRKQEADSMKRKEVKVESGEQQPISMKYKEVAKSQQTFSMMWPIIIAFVIGLIGFFLYYHIIN